MFNKQQL